MKQDEGGKANNAFSRPGNQGFTWIELLIVILGSICLILVFLPDIIMNHHTKDRARRINCLSNQNGMWKAASQWGLDPIKTWRVGFPETNLAGALASDAVGVTPEIFICPGATRTNSSWGIYTATNLADIRANSCNYAYFGGRTACTFFGGHTAEASALVLIADKNGSNNLPSATAWGGNHDGKGGNVIKVSGQGFWVSTPAESKDAQYCITNSSVADAFTNTGLVYSY